MKRLAEVKIQEPFESNRHFVTFSRPFVNILHTYLEGGFQKSKAYEIIDTYGQYVVTRGIFGGYMKLCMTTTTEDFQNNFSSEQSSKECFEAVVSAKASSSGFSAQCSASTTGCTSKQQEEGLFFTFAHTLRSPPGHSLRKSDVCRGR